MAELVKLLLLVSIFLTVLALALRAKAGDTLHLFQHWKLGLCALAAMFVIVPIVAVLLAEIFNLKPAVKLALVALAFSPVPPLLPKKQTKAGGSHCYVTGLLVAASLASLIVTPLGLHLAGRAFSVELSVPVGTIARILMIGIGAPLIVGLTGARLLGARSPQVAHVIARIAAYLFMACVAAMLVRLAPTIWAVIGQGTLPAMVAVIVSGLAAGYWLGGKDREDKIVLSLAAATRHPGIALAIVSSNFPNAALAPAAVVLFAVLNAIIGFAYVRILKGVPVA